MTMQCLKQWSQWEPEAAKAFEEGLDELFAMQADVSVEDWRTACSIVRHNGWYGPTWADDGGPFGYTEAIRIVNRGAQASIDDIEYCDPEYHSYDPDGNEPNARIAASAIKREKFAWYIEIYGGLP